MSHSRRWSCLECGEVLGWWDHGTLELANGVRFDPHSPGAQVTVLCSEGHPRVVVRVQVDAVQATESR